MSKNFFLHYFQVTNLFFSFFRKNKHNQFSRFSNDTDNVVTVFDIGSNTGAYIKFVSKKLSTIKLNIHSFEPIVELAEEQKRIKFPKHHQVKINNFAVGRIEEIKTLYIRKLVSQSSFQKKHHLNNVLSSIKEERNVNVINLKNYIKENDIKKIDVLKIDTEGLELEILHSINELLKSKLVKTIKIELSNFDNLFEDITNFLFSHNFKIEGFDNQFYRDNKLVFLDAYFVQTN